MAGRLVRHDYTGTVREGRITGMAQLAGGIEPLTLPWSAVRSGSGGGRAAD